MLITFKSPAYANITMFGDVGKRMLDLMGYGSTVPGAIDPEDLPQALANLRRGLAALPDEVEPAGDADEDQSAVSVHTRAVPLIALLEAAIADESYLRWE